MENGVTKATEKLLVMMREEKVDPAQVGDLATNIWISLLVPLVAMESNAGGRTHEELIDELLGDVRTQMMEHVKVLAAIVALQKLIKSVKDEVKPTDAEPEVKNLDDAQEVIANLIRKAS